MAGQPPDTAGFVLDDVGEVDDLSDGELELLHEALGYPPGRSVASMRRQLHRPFHSEDPPPVCLRSQRRPRWLGPFLAPQPPSLDPLPRFPPQIRARRSRLPRRLGTRATAGDGCRGQAPACGI